MCKGKHFLRASSCDPSTEKPNHKQVKLGWQKKSSSLGRKTYSESTLHLREEEKKTNRHTHVQTHLYIHTNTKGKTSSGDELFEIDLISAIWYSEREIAHQQHVDARSLEERPHLMAVYLFSI